MYCVIQSGLGSLNQDGDVCIGKELAAKFETWVEAAEFAYDQYVGHHYLSEDDFAESIKNGWIFIETI